MAAGLRFDGMDYIALGPVGAVSNRTASRRVGTGHGGESVYLFLEFTIIRFGSGDRNRKGKNSDKTNLKRHTARYVTGRIR